MHKYRLVAKKGEGTFSEVLKAQSIKNGKYVAIKCMKNHFDSLDQVNNLREIQALRRLSPHPNIIKLTEVLYDQPTGRLALVFELMDMNIYELIRGRRHYVAEDRVKNYMYQLMKSMDHMHRNGIFHRDIKPENILIMDDCLKLADFGSCRGIYSKQPYTEYISTRWYRAPECLLTDGYYNYKMDMWGVGCVFFEIVSLFPLFPGTNELDQIQKIHNILGTPPPELLAKMKKRNAHMDFNFPAKEGSGIARLIPHVSPECCDLIVRLLMYNPDERLSARQALRHAYFKDLRDAEKRQKALLAQEAGTTLELQREPSMAGSEDPPQNENSMMKGETASTLQHSESSAATALPSITLPKQHAPAPASHAPTIPTSVAPAASVEEAQESNAAAGAHVPSIALVQEGSTAASMPPIADPVAASSGSRSAHHLPGLSTIPAVPAASEAAAAEDPGGLPVIGSLKHNQVPKGKGSIGGPTAGALTFEPANFKNRGGRGAAGKFTGAQKQSSISQITNKGGTIPGIAGAHLTQDPPAPPPSYKYKGAGAKGAGKYMSPYSLMTMSVKDVPAQPGA